MPARSRTILAVNPSYQTDIEHRFWSEMAVAADDAGWRLLQIAARRIPDVPKADTITLPVRLQKLAAQWDTLPRSELVSQPKWLRNQDVHLQVEWEHRRHEIVSQTPEIADGVRRLSWFVDRTLELCNPAIVLTTNKIDHPCALFQRAARFHDISVGLIERSPFDSIWYEPDGLFAESRIWPFLDEADPGVSNDRSRRMIETNPAGFRISEASDRRPFLSRLQRPIVFLPFDNTLWTGWAQPDHPQRSVDNPAYLTPQDAVDDLSEAVAELGGSLIIKPHPSCHETKHLGLHANTYMVDGAIDHFIHQSDVVAAFNTKIAFVSLALGQGTATFADNPAAGSGLTAHWRDFGSTVETLRAGLDPARRPRSNDVDAFFTLLADQYFYDVEPRSKRSPRALVDSLIADIPESLAPVPASTVARLKAMAEGDASALPARVGPRVRGRSGTGRVIIDVSRLVDPRAVHSGIARYGREMLARLPDLVGGEVWAVVREPTRGWTLENLELFDNLRRATGGRVISLKANQRFDAVNQTLRALTEEDVVHSIHLPLPSIAETGAALRMITIHDVLHVIRPELNPGGTPTIARVLDGIDVDRDVVVCDSHQTWRDVLKLVPISSDRVKTIHLGSSVAPVVATKRNDDVVAVLQSEIRKNSTGVMKAVAASLAKPEFASTRFTAVIAPGSRSDVLGVLNATALERSRVRLVESPSDRELRGLLRKARAFVFGSQYEGFGLPVLEAMSEGCPTVVPMNSSLVEVAGSAVCYAASESSADLRVALDSVLRDDDYARDLSERARRRAQALSWDHSASRLAEAYDEVRMQRHEH